MTNFRLDDLHLGEERLPLFLPDIGTFFNQDLGVARAMIDSLAGSGIRIVKGEVLHDPRIALDVDHDVVYFDHSRNAAIRENYRQLILRKTNPLASYRELFGYIAGKGLKLVVSVYDAQGVDFALGEGAIALKIASSNIVHAPLIRHVAATGMPMIIDTGRSTLDEIVRAVAWARDAGASNILVEHSPAAPPAPIDQQHLRMMVTLGKVCDCPFGLSHHSAREEVLLAAVALGASLIEAGVCPDARQPDQDVAHAVPVGRVADVVNGIGAVHAALGMPMRPLTQSLARHPFRMGLVAHIALSEGQELTPDAVGFAAPALGVPVEFWDTVAGWKAVRRIACGDVIRWQDLSPPTSRDLPQHRS